MNHMDLTEGHNGQALILARLMAWMSPVFPTGGFAYSAGLETACRNGLVKDTDSLYDWLSDQLTLGSLRNNVILLAEARRCSSSTALSDVNDLALALAGSAERFQETILQGDAFLTAAHPWMVTHGPGRDRLPLPCALPVAVGSLCALGHIPVTQALTAYCHAFVSSQLQAAIRLSVTGQTGATDLLYRLETPILHTADHLTDSTLDDLGSAALTVDICLMNHEVQAGRLFRS